MSAPACVVVGTSVSQARFGEARELVSDEILRILVLWSVMSSGCVGWQVQDVLNRYHNVFQDPMDTRHAPGSRASPIWRPMWSAWLRADGAGRSLVLAAGRAGDLAVASSRRQDRNRVPAVTGA